MGCALEPGTLTFHTRVTAANGAGFLLQRENKTCERELSIQSELLPGRHPARTGWIATVEVTSEDPRLPIESVFAAEGGPGWRASQKGEQEIRLIFDQALPVRRIGLRRDATRAPMQRPEWQGAASPAAPNSNPRRRRALACCGQTMVLQRVRLW